jgi:ubiquitin-like-conjugating enzyme ATG3
VSTFYTNGQLTPEEFVAAGDLLHRQCPTWKWEAGDPKKAISALPADKQFLVARGIPCYRRAKAVMGGGDNITVKDTTKDPSPEDDGLGFNLVTKTGESSSSGSGTPSTGPEPVDTSDDPIDEDDEPIDEADDPSAAPTKAGGGGAKHRKYEASITYDKIYSSPRFWLRGVDEDGTTALTQQQIFEDISDDHARKTVTMEPHFHLAIVYASIHPCKHAHTMKMMMEMAKEEEKERRRVRQEQLAAAGGSSPSSTSSASSPSSASATPADPTSEELLPVDQYFVFFLKFIATICPTIDIDFTVAARL